MLFKEVSLELYLLKISFFDYFLYTIDNIYQIDSSKFAPKHLHIRLCGLCYQI